MKPSELVEEILNFDETMNKLGKAYQKYKTMFNSMPKRMKYGICSIGGLITGLGLGCVGLYAYQIRPLISTLTKGVNNVVPKKDDNEEKYKQLVKEMNDDIGEDGNLLRFKRVNEKYDKMKILHSPAVSREIFVELCCEKLKDEEKEDIKKLFHYYYHGLIREICEVGKETYGNAPILMLCSEKADSCFYAKTMTYIVASHIASIDSTLTPETFKRRIEGYLANYTKFCKEFMCKEPMCKGLILSENEVDCIVREVLQKKFSDKSNKWWKFW